MAERMRLLSGLRNKIETVLDELASVSSSENVRLQQTLREAVEKSQLSMSSAANGELLRALERERSERLRAVEIAKKFKTEGTAVMMELKQSLKEMQHRYQALLREKGNVPPAVQSADNRERVQVLTSLLDEQDVIVEQLQQRRHTLEGRVRQLERQVATLTNAQPAHVPSELLEEFARTETPHGGSMPASRLRSLVHALIARLKAEQVQRLQVEEQATQLTDAQNQGLRRMEERIRELEQRGPPPSGPATPADATRPNLGGTDRCLAVPKLTGTQPVAVAAPAPRFGSHTAAEPDSFPSLEERLQAVSNEFQASLRQWQTIVSTENAEFLPDSP